MSTGRDHWTLRVDCLKRAYERWHLSDPDELLRRQVKAALRELLADPLHWGVEDEERGIFTGRVPGIDLLIVYVVNLDERSVCVALFGPVD